MHTPRSITHIYTFPIVECVKIFGATTFIRFGNIALVMDESDGMALIFIYIDTNAWIGFPSCIDPESIDLCYAITIDIAANGVCSNAPFPNARNPLDIAYHIYKYIYSKHRYSYSVYM